MNMKILPQGPVIQVEDLGKRFEIGVKQKKESFLATTRRLINGNSSLRELWALRHVTFSVNRGETLGVIGPNGAGKSTLLLLLAQILGPTEGGCRVSSRTHCFFRIGSALQPRLTVLENFSLCCALLGLSRREFRRRLPAMIAYSGLEEYLYAKYGELSTGLAARLPFAAAVHTDLDIILVDEMLLVGDRQFQAKCLKTFHEFKAQGKTLVIVSHSLPMIESLCDRTLYLNSGKMAFLGDSAAAIRMLIRDQGNSGQPEQGAEGGRFSAPRAQVRRIVEETTARLRMEAGAATKELRGAVSREFTAAPGIPPQDKQLRGLIDEEVRRIAPGLHKALEASRALPWQGQAPESGPEDEQLPAAAQYRASLPALIQKGVEEQLLKFQQEMKDAMEASRQEMKAAMEASSRELRAAMGDMGAAGNKEVVKVPRTDGPAVSRPYRTAGGMQLRSFRFRDRSTGHNGDRRGKKYQSWRRDHNDLRDLAVGGSGHNRLRACPGLRGP
jgi:ABC-type polysaccharide/polyol phosphate transport system ATPase subunit